MPVVYIADAATVPCVRATYRRHTHADSRLMGGRGCGRYHKKQLSPAGGASLSSHVDFSSPLKSAAIRERPTVCTRQMNSSIFETSALPILWT